MRRFEVRVPQKPVPKAFTGHRAFVLSARFLVTQQRKRFLETTENRVLLNGTNAI
jgi:hypothetical protein